ncbi:MAG: stage III sporulation AC/AD family protein [Oscillospiraceae bacterium]|nr:stage III sporulation AC/AD family protein [Oscillospiraceae bacterium]
MNLISFVGAGIIAALLSIVIKQYKPEFGMYISLIAGVIMLLAIIQSITPILDTISELIGVVSLNAAYGTALLKALAICYITQLACDTCRDSGETAIASKIEMAGKLAIVLVSLPLFASVVNTVSELINL